MTGNITPVDPSASTPYKSAKYSMMVPAVAMAVSLPLFLALGSFLLLGLQDTDRPRDLQLMVVMLIGFSVATYVVSWIIFQTLMYLVIFNDKLRRESEHEPSNS